jgi:hypothetical protein
MIAKIHQPLTTHWQNGGGDEHILNFLFSAQLPFRQTNKAGQQNQQ